MVVIVIMLHPGCPIRNSDQMTISKTHPTLLTTRRNISPDSNKASEIELIAAKDKLFLIETKIIITCYIAKTDPDR